MALGIAFYAHAGLLTGGTVGIAFLANYQAGWSFGLVFCLVNLPFYLLGIWRMGWAFTLRTGCAVLLVSLLAELTPQWVAFAHLNALYLSLIHICPADTRSSGRRVSAGRLSAWGRGYWSVRRSGLRR